jgi:hypothetical protein
MKRLDALINAFLETARPGNKELTVRDKVRVLSEPGLRPIEIARILGISVNQVNVILSALRKEKRAKKKPRQKPRKKNRKKSNR